MRAVAAKPATASILLLDDDSRLRSARGVVLSTHGYEVDFAATAADVQRHCSEHSPDLVLVGLGSRAGSTFSLLEQVRRANPRQRVGFLIHENHSLCPVLFNGRTVLAREGPDNLVGRVEALLEWN